MVDIIFSTVPGRDTVPVIRQLNINTTTPKKDVIYSSYGTIPEIKKLSKYKSNFTDKYSHLEEVKMLMHYIYYSRHKSFILSLILLDTFHTILVKKT